LGRRHPAMNAVQKPEGGWEIHVGLGDGVVPDGGFSNFNDWWRYDVDTNVWSELPGFPSSRRHHPFYFGLGGTSYVGLGHSDGYFPYIERDWYSYHPSDGNWQNETQFASYDTIFDDSSATLTYSAGPVTTEARVAGTEFSIELPLVGGTSELVGSLGFVLSGDGDDHRTMAEGEFHAFYPSGNLLMAGPGGNSSSWWRRLPPHPGVSRWAPGSFVMRGSARAYFTSGYDRDEGVLFADLWRIDLSPLFSQEVTSLTNILSPTTAPASLDLPSSPTETAQEATPTTDTLNEGDIETATQIGTATETDGTTETPTGTGTASTATTPESTGIIPDGLNEVVSGSFSPRCGILGILLATNIIYLYSFN